MLVLIKNGFGVLNFKYDERKYKETLVGLLVDGLDKLCDGS